VSTSWNPPTGPPIGAPIRPVDARREIDDALDAAWDRDRELRAEVAAVARGRVLASDQLAVSTDEATEAIGLAKRALTRADESARAGQRADAAKWTAAAQVFAMRLRDAREQVAALEQHLAAAAERAQQVEAALVTNVGRLEAVVAARLPMLSGRKAARVRRSVDEVLAQITLPTDDLVARAVQSARAAADDAEAAGDDEVAPMSTVDLEHEVDLESTDAILDELRSELGLPGPGPAAPRPAEAAAAPAGESRSPSPSGGTAGPTAPSGGTAGPTAPATPARNDPAGPVPVARR
jgi:hypothetical protein